MVGFGQVHSRLDAHALQVSEQASTDTPHFFHGSVKQYPIALEMDEANRELGEARRRIVALESQVRQLKSTAIAAISHSAAGQSAAIYQSAYKGV